MKTAQEWSKECQYISDVADKRGRVPEMNNDTATFIRYCEMQQAAATKAGFHDSATYIGECLDDLRASITPDYGYLQHGAGTAGPFRTERVAVKNEYADKWLARFEGKWRRVHIQLKRTFIVFQGEKITIQIEGV